MQPTIDMLLNISIFIWYGAICPWVLFRVNNVIPIWRLIILGILVLLLRRIPVVFAMHRFIHQIEHFQQAAFVGFFGPIGVSAIFYLYVSIEFLEDIKLDGVVREDARHLQDVMTVVIWFLVICSIIAHGLSIPMGKLGLHLPRTISAAISSDREDGENERAFALSRLGNVGELRKRKAKKAVRGSDPQIVRVPGFQLRSAAIHDEENDSGSEPQRPVNFIERDTPVPAERVSTPTLAHSSLSRDSSSWTEPVSGRNDRRGNK